jgi:DNA-binding transcriptional ArsR family regulator
MSAAAPADHEALAISAELTAKYFRALGDPTRLRILERILEQPMTVSDLVRELGCPQSNVSNHLACLRWCGFLEAESRGKWTYYSVRDPKVRALIDLGRTLVAENAEHIAACARIGAK